MHWKSKSWILIGILLAAFTAAHAQIATTTVADTIHHADGTPATGTALISWPAFTTSNGDVIPTGSTSTTIAAGGALSVQLIPNAGAIPIGSYYTIVYHLDDGSISRQYWVVPASSSPVKVSAIESTVLPASVAMQTVSKSYVDTAIAAAVTGHPLDSNPFTLKSGDTMTGPLILPADPVSANQAADKNYVDESVAASANVEPKMDLDSPPAIGMTTPVPNIVEATRLLNAASANCPQFGGLYTYYACDTSIFSINSASLISPDHVPQGHADLFAYWGPGPFNSIGYGNDASITSSRSLDVVATGMVGHAFYEHKSSVGDNEGFGINQWDDAGCAFAADQCDQPMWIYGGESFGYPSHITISSITPSTGPAIQTAVFASVTGCGTPDQVCVPSTGSRIFDITQGGANRYMTAGPASLTGPCAVPWVSSIATAGGSGALPTFSACGVQTAANIPGNTSADAPVSATITFATGTGTFSTGLATLIGSNFAEHVLITALSGPAGTQTVTFLTGRPNVGVLMVQDSVAHPDPTLGGDFSLDAVLNLTGYRTSYIYVGSPDGTNAWFTTEAYGQTNPLGGNANFPFNPASTAGTGDPNAEFHTYCAARVTKGNMEAWGSFFAYLSAQLEPSACTFATPDAIEDPDYDAQGTQGLSVTVNQNTAFPDGMNGANFAIEGAGASGTDSQVLWLGNGNPDTAWYDLSFNGRGGSGKLEPPNAVMVGGSNGGANVFHDLISMPLAPTSWLIEAPTANSGQTQLGLIGTPWGGIFSQANNGSPQIYIANAGLGVQGYGNFQDAVTASNVNTPLVNLSTPDAHATLLTGSYSATSPAFQWNITNNTSWDFASYNDLAHTWGPVIASADGTGAEYGQTTLNLMNGDGTTPCASLICLGPNAGINSAGDLDAQGANIVVPSGTWLGGLNISGNASGEISFGVTNLSNSTSWNFMVGGSTGNPATDTGPFCLLTTLTNGDGVEPACFTQTSEVYGSTSVAAWTNVALDGYGHLGTVDTGLSRGAAGVLDVGNGTQGDKSGTIAAAQYLGPATAPTGSCPANGAWVFSQDGHATFCAAGTWTTKI